MSELFESYRRDVRCTGRYQVWELFAREGHPHVRDLVLPQAGHVQLRRRSKIQRYGTYWRFPDSASVISLCLSSSELSVPSGSFGSSSTPIWLYWKRPESFPDCERAGSRVLRYSRLTISTTLTRRGMVVVHACRRGFLLLAGAGSSGPSAAATDV